MKDCFERRGNEDFVQLAVASIKNCYEYAGVLDVSSLETENSQDIDSQLSYHIHPRKEYSRTLEMKAGGIVRLVENKAYKVYGVVKVRLKIFDNREFVL